MKAGILAVGSELLSTDRVDSNSLMITDTLERFGVELLGKAVVGDDGDEISRELEHFLAKADLIIVSGGLGPTEDDITREAVAEATHRKLNRDATILASLRERFSSYGLEMPMVNEKQADVIEGAVVLINPNGTAPGQKLEVRQSTVFLFPGVPSELESMMSADLLPWLKARTDGEVVETRVLRVACLGESTLEQKIQPAYHEFGRHGITVLSSPGEIQIRLRARGGDRERTTYLEQLSSRLYELAAGSIYGEGADTSLEEVLGGLLIDQSKTVATAESCTGGLVAERLTRIPGSSSYFLGSVVAYDNSVKTKQLGVSPVTIESYGAVSPEVVGEMAEGVIERLQSDLGIAISGIAGPGGGTEEKPVGTVYIAVGEAGRETELREFRLPGDRTHIRRLASQWALELLRRRVLGDGHPHGSRIGEPAAGQRDQNLRS